MLPLPDPHAASGPSAARVTIDFFIHGSFDVDQATLRRPDEPAVTPEFTGLAMRWER